MNFMHGTTKNLTNFLLFRDHFSFWIEVKEEGLASQSFYFLTNIWKLKTIEFNNI